MTDNTIAVVIATILGAAVGGGAVLLAQSVQAHGEGRAALRAICAVLRGNLAVLEGLSTVAARLNVLDAPWLPRPVRQTFDAQASPAAL